MIKVDFKVACKHFRKSVYYPEINDKINLVMNCNYKTSDNKTKSTTVLKTGIIIKINLIKNNPNKILINNVIDSIVFKTENGAEITTTDLDKIIYLNEYIKIINEEDSDNYIYKNGKWDFYIK